MTIDQPESNASLDTRDPGNKLLIHTYESIIPKLLQQPHGVHIITINLPHLSQASMKGVSLVSCLHELIRESFDSGPC